MSTFDATLWQQLLHSARSTPAVSLYLPTHRSGEQVRQDRIRLKNLLSEAERELEELGHSPTYIDMVLEPGQNLLFDEDFWQHQDRGLVVLLRDGKMHEFRVALSLEEKCVVSDNYHLKPLLPLISGNGRFHVLTLSLKNIRVFTGDRDCLERLELDGVPRSLTEVVGAELERPGIQCHSGRSPAQGGSAATIFHGQGGGDDDQHLEVERFLREVDQSLSASPVVRTVPLVLAGVDEIVGHFRKVSNHPQIVRGSLRGNFDRVNPQQIHRAAWELVRPTFVGDRSGDRERFRKLEGTGLASAQLEDIIVWARQGRIETLFVDPRHQAWGRLDSERPELHDQRQLGDEDLVDRAAVWSLRQGAKVHAGSPEQLGLDAPLAAILRY
jgi:hypothetical protein